MPTGRPLSVLLVLLGLEFGCGHVETAPGLELTPAEQQGLESAVSYAAFWNPGCDRRQIIVERVDEFRNLVELSVCGEVRRYQRLAPIEWLDVTSATAPRAAASVKSR
jgi:hypothetical protein